MARKTRSDADNAKGAFVRVSQFNLSRKQYPGLYEHLARLPVDRQKHEVIRLLEVGLSFERRAWDIVTHQEAVSRMSAPEGAGDSEAPARPQRRAGHLRAVGASEDAEMGEFGESQAGASVASMADDFG